MPTLNAEIITSGTEILLGDIVDTNAAWIAQQLREAGVNLYYKSTVGDNELRLRGVIELGMTRSDVIIITGGLGPTVDDITRDAIANATGCPLELHEGAIATLQARFARFGATMTDNNRQQALIPHGAILIENPVGTAPGFIVETTRCAVIALPGVPREMKQLMADSVLPYLRARLGSQAVIRRRILRTFGIGESTIDHRLGELLRCSNPTVGLAAQTGQCDIRIAARAEDAATAEGLLDVIETEVRRELGEFIYSTVPGESYESVLVRQLQSAGVTLALLETNTRGALAARLSAAEPAYNPLLKQIVTDDESLPAMLGKAPSSEPESHQMLASQSASWLRTVSGATLGVALVGTSGADEGVFGRQAGATWLAIADSKQVANTHIAFGGQDDYTHVRIGNQTLATLRRWLKGEHNA
jgi:nicotinamide-nucleotide amidase